MSRLALEKLTKRFGPVTAVEDLSLTVESGELVALVGPSGCGKTTTLRLIAGFEQPDEGEITLDGQSIVSLPPEARRVGIVFQNYALFPHMSVTQNVAYGLKFLKRPVDVRRRVRELLELVDLVGLEHRKPAELSAGQQQRVALARALAPEPQVLLLDEPLSALDVQLRVRLRIEIKRLQRRLGITTLYVTHDQEEALAIADRVAVMSEGQLEQVGTPWAVYHEPASLTVARFIGRGNLLEGRVISVEGERVRVALDSGGQVVVLRCSRSTVDPGRSVHLLVRPEKLHLGSAGENTLRGRVLGTEYLGDSLLLYVECPSGTWLIKLPDPDEEAFAAEGQEIAFGFSPENGLLIGVGTRDRDSV
jgi:thiamine transport system ATP-binding protein